VIFTSPPRIGYTVTIIVESPTPSQSDYADENVMSQQQPSWDFMAFIETDNNCRYNFTTIYTTKRFLTF